MRPLTLNARAAALLRVLERGVGLPARRTAARLSPRARRLLAAVACAAALLAAGYLLWLRDSSLVQVERATVTGLTTAEAGKIRAALKESALGMTTLHVEEEELERAVASYPAVAGVEATSDFPHRLAIEVIERRPIAAVEGPDGGEVPVAADGTLLPDFGPADRLAQLPAATSAVTGSLTGEKAVTALAAVDAAPRALGRRIEAIEEDGDGELAAILDGGPRVLLGDGSSLDAKWTAAAAAIAEGGAAGAEYVDVSLPERPAAGG